MGAYARLYQLLMAAGHDTWQDYVLDQVGGIWGACFVHCGPNVTSSRNNDALAGRSRCTESGVAHVGCCKLPSLFIICPQILFARENSFARAVAQGGADEKAAAMEAVAYDLDMLQVGFTGFDAAD